MFIIIGKVLTCFQYLLATNISPPLVVTLVLVICHSPGVAWHFPRYMACMKTMCEYTLLHTSYLLGNAIWEENFQYKIQIKFDCIYLCIVCNIHLIHLFINMNNKSILAIQKFATQTAHSPFFHQLPWAFNSCRNSMKSVHSLHLMVFLLFHQSTIFEI